MANSDFRLEPSNWLIFLNRSKALKYLNMPAISTAIVARDSFAHIAKRNWASEEPGVIVVFCITFLVLVGLVALFIHKKLAARRERRQQVV